MVTLFSLIKDYLVDQEARIRQLITWFFKPCNGTIIKKED